jgi:hypothetical protein
MSSPYLTGNKYEILCALPVVHELAKDTLSPSQLEEAEDISIMLAGSKSRKREAIYRLIEMVAPPPKRPLYYAQHELEFLPRWTRNGIRYLGDYIDLLVKALAFEITKDTHCTRNSLGTNIHMLSPKKYGVPQELVDKLKKYNSFLYQPGKHDFNTRGRRHRFTSKEVVFTAFITMKLADEIKKLSKHAKMVSLDRAELGDLNDNE